MADRRSDRVPKVVRGSVVTNRRRCGKPNCRCAREEALHESVVLSYSQDGRTRFLTLPAAEVTAVRAATERYRAERRRVEAAGQAGLEALLDRLGGRR